MEIQKVDADPNLRYSTALERLLQVLPNWQERQRGSWANSLQATDSQMELRRCTKTQQEEGSGSAWTIIRREGGTTHRPRRIIGRYHSSQLLGGPPP